MCEQQSDSVAIEKEKRLPIPLPVLFLYDEEKNSHGKEVGWADLYTNFHSHIFQSSLPNVLTACYTYKKVLLRPGNEVGKSTIFIFLFLPINDRLKKQT